MEPGMILAIVFGILLTIGGSVLLFLAFKIGWKYMVQEKRCTAKTTGVVRKYGLGTGTDIMAAIVFFEVNGKTYKAKSWTPMWATKKTKMSFSRNEQTYEEKDNVGSFTFTQTPFVKIEQEPTRRKYPKGTILDVWYDPKNPKLCYAERYSNKKALFWIFLLGAIFVYVVDIIVLFVLLIATA